MLYFFAFFLQKVGRQLKQGESFGIIESAKATSDLYAPCSGKIVAVNTSVESQPSLINRAPFGTSQTLFCATLYDFILATINAGTFLYFRRVVN